MKKKGFTLIELLAVIIILAVIALIATPIVLNVVDNAKESARKSSVNGYADATRMAIYDYQFANNGTYPNVDKIWAENNAKTKGDTVNCEEVHFSEIFEVVLHKCNVGSNEKKYCHANGKTYEDCENEEQYTKSGGQHRFLDIKDGWWLGTWCNTSVVLYVSLVGDINGLLPNTSQFGSNVTYTSGNMIDTVVTTFTNTIDSKYRYQGNDTTFGIGIYGNGVNYSVV